MNLRDIQVIMSGECKTWRGAGLLVLLSLLEPFYTIGVTTIRTLYNLRILPSRRVRQPVISVGNITTGGTGKTPVVALLTHRLQRQGFRPGIASRGYRALPADDVASSAANMVNDEKLLLDRLCPDVPHLQHKDRTQVARELIREHTCDRIILDDGFQHRRLARDLDLVLIDALNPFGYGHLLPRGLLREPLTSLSRADLLAITRVDQVSEEELREIRETLQIFTRAPLLEIRFEAVGWLNRQGARLPLTPWPVAPVVCCGIGNPDNFRRQLQGLGLEFPAERWHPYPDHHHYTTTDIDSLVEQVQQTAGTLVTTLKDFVKLAPQLPEEIDCLALMIEAKLSPDSETLLQEHLQKLSQTSLV